MQIGDVITQIENETVENISTISDIVNKEERLVDMLVLMRKYGMEGKELKILPSTKGASVVMIKARKGGKSGLKILL